MHNWMKISAIRQKNLQKIVVGVVLCLWLIGTGLTMWVFNPIPKTTSIACHTLTSNLQQKTAILMKSGS